MIQDGARIGPMQLLADVDPVMHPVGVVVFAHGSGSNRLSPRNRRVADTLHRYRLATVLFDLLTDDEATDRHKVFDIDLLAGRVAEALDWTQAQPGLAALRTGLFGASTGAAAALQAAALHPRQVAAIVLRGGRVDLAVAALPLVRAPSLLIVGANDPPVLEINRDAMRHLHCEKRLEVVPGAGHLFEESGALDTVAHLAGAWFVNHFSRPGWV